MENRRPPRSNSSGRKPYFDRGRGAQPFRENRTGGQPHGKGRKFYKGDGRNKDAPESRSGGDGKQRDARKPGEFRPRGDGRRPAFDRRVPRHDDRGRNRNRKNEPVRPEIKITSDAQITDGKFRGRTLLNSDSPRAVVTSRKIREIAFKIVARRVKAARVLDLGAGPGTIGIEAISRGAMLATFVERSARMCSFIRKNLAELAIKDGHGEVVEMEILPFLVRSSRRRRLWDIVYFDVPNGDEHAAILDHLSRGRSIREGGMLLIEHDSATKYPDNISSLKRRRTIEHGEKLVSIYERI